MHSFSISLTQRAANAECTSIDIDQVEPAAISQRGLNAQRISALDGWRGIAILLVLLDHLQPRFGLDSVSVFKRLEYLGVHGVAIFFVLSGFLITGKLLAEYEENRRLNLASFYVRRFFRLMPCVWVYLGILALVHLLRAQEAVGCIFFFRNFLYLPHQGLTGHFWSLSIEEQFYLVWPILLWFLLRVGGQRAAIGAALIFAFVVAAWRFSARDYLYTAPIMATFGTQFHADALLIGCVTAFAPSKWASSRSIRSLLSPMLILLIACIVILRRVIPLTESALIGFVIWGTVSCRIRMVTRVLEFRPLVYLGLISYSVYVWQQPLSFLSSDSISVSTIKFAVVLVLGFMSYNLLERPMITRGRKVTAQFNRMPS